MHPQERAEAIATEHERLAHPFQAGHHQRRADQPDHQNGGQFALDRAERRLDPAC
jgi:histidine ammonia-lyase